MNNLFRMNLDITKKIIETISFINKIHKIQIEAIMTLNKKGLNNNTMKMNIPIKNIIIKIRISNNILTKNKMNTIDVS